MAGIKTIDIYKTFRFLDVGNKLDYKIISRKDGKHCGWIRKFCISKEQVEKESKRS